MICNLPGHLGRREVFRYRVLYDKDGNKTEGCFQCTDGMSPSVFPTTKRMILSKGTGKEYWMSPAHRRDIKMRRVAPDLSHVWKDKRGLGDRVKLVDNTPRMYPNGVDTRDVRVYSRSFGEGK